jgi:cell wall-associated NlpC family hydrolase
MTEQEQRAEVVKEARSCLRTPYLSHARIKGVGLDCATFLELVYANTDIFRATELPELSLQWFLHADREWYLEHLRRYAVEFADRPPQPGDIVCARHGRAYSHGAIVTEWPRVIHCFPPCVMETNALYDPQYMGRPLKFFDPWGVAPTSASAGPACGKTVAGPAGGGPGVPCRLTADR